MSLNIDDQIRCRMQLKPYYHQRIKFVGYLASIGLNKNIKEKIQNEHNALFLDVHGLKTIKDNPHQQNIVDVDLDHIHCMIQSRHLTDYLNRFITFSATVSTYQTIFNHKKETRYGLNHIMIHSFDSNELNHLNKKYRHKLTTYQSMIVNNIVKQLPKNYPDRRMFTVNEIKTALFRISTVIDRSNFLIHTSNTLHNKEPLSQHKLEFFTENPKATNNFDLNQYFNAVNEVKQIKQTNLKIQQKLVTQKLMYQTQLKEQQRIIQQQSQKIKFYQTLKNYLDLPTEQNFNNTSTTKSSNAVVPKAKLEELQSHFNQQR